MKRFRRNKKQSGLAVIEFTVVSVVILMLLFGIFEIGRYVFNLQMLNEITRRTARIAAVCHPEDGATNVDGMGVSVGSNISNMAVIANALPSGVSPSDVTISYLDENGTVVADPANNITDVWFVRTGIDVNYRFFFMFSDIGVISLPDFETTLPAENLGLLRYGSKADDYADCGGGG